MLNLFGRAVRVSTADAVIEVASDGDAVIDISDNSLHLDIDSPASCSRSLMGDLLSVTSNWIGHRAFFSWITDKLSLYNIYDYDDFERKQYYVENAPFRFLMEKNEKAFCLISKALHNGLSYDDLKPPYTFLEKLGFVMIGVGMLGSCGVILYGSSQNAKKEDTNKKNIAACADNEFCVEAIKEGVVFEDAKKFNNQYQILALRGKEVSVKGALEIDSLEEFEALERGTLFEGPFDRSELLMEDSFQDEIGFQWF